MTMHKALPPRNGIDRLYVSSKEASIEDCVDILTKTTRKLYKRNKERLITAIRSNTNNTRINRTTTRKQK